MIAHCVFCDIREGAPAHNLDALFAQLGTFARGLEGVISFDAGPNRDFEAKSARYNAGFVIRFRDADALKAYARHPTHRALGARLARACNGGAEGIIVFDLECA
ncbi:MAG: Dabb family protein [Pseudomonadota bacterium]